MINVRAFLDNLLTHHHRKFTINPKKLSASLAGAGTVEYTDCISAGVRSSTHPLNECPGYYIKRSDSEFPVMLKLGRMRSTPSLPSLLCLLWPGVVEPDRALSVSQIELFDI